MDTGEYSYMTKVIKPLYKKLKTRLAYLRYWKDTHNSLPSFNYRCWHPWDVKTPGYHTIVVNVIIIMKFPYWEWLRKFWNISILLTCLSVPHLYPKSQSGFRTGCSTYRQFWVVRSRVSSNSHCTRLFLTSVVWSCWQYIRRFGKLSVFTEIDICFKIVSLQIWMLGVVFVWKTGLHSRWQLLFY